MDKYLDSFRVMISLRGLTDHTLKNYCTYIRAYLDYLSHVLHKAPEDISWQELRDYIKWLQHSRNLSDRTINCAISQLRFFTLYVLHKPWDDTQLPMRRFDEFLPLIVSVTEKEVSFWAKDYKSGQTVLISTAPDEFIRRLMMHVLPSGFQKIRCYGFLNNRSKKKNLHIIFRIQGHQKFVSLFTGSSVADVMKAVWKYDIRLCPCCGKNLLIYIICCLY